MTEHRNGGGARSGSGRKKGKSVKSVAVTEERKQVFLEALRRHGIVAAAARAASPHAENASSTFNLHRRKDPEFAAAWDAALEEAASSVELEIHRRAVEGYEEPVYQKGEMVGTITKYSDRLLELRARGLMPEKYAMERRDLRVSGQLNHQHEHHHSGTILTIKPEDVLLLPIAEREALLALLSKIATERGEVVEGEGQYVRHLPE